jgi:hypothetical protein
VSTRSETKAPRLAGAILCAAASLLLTLCALYMYAGEGVGWGAGLPLVAGVGLLPAALKSYRAARRGA